MSVARQAVPVRIWIIGKGTVGQWVADAIGPRGDAFAESHGVTFAVVGTATRREGFVGVEGRRWEDPLDGMRETDADLLVQTVASPQSGQPGADFIRHALGRGIPVVTSDKWPIARFGLELTRLAEERGAVLRVESTVMSGTPLVAPLSEGLAGAGAQHLRGVVNATVNSMLSDMRAGRTYAEALEAAQAAGLAEPDPSADVDGHDSVAKAMILAARVFGRQLDLDCVERRGVSALEPAEIDALRRGGCVREVTTLGWDGSGKLSARVQPEVLEEGDPLAAIAGTMNCVITEAEPLGEVRIAGPGAGPQLAGQGVLSDLIRVASDMRRST